MRGVIPRVSSAGVTIDGREHSRIGEGLLVLLGIVDEVTMDDIVCLFQKIVNVRILNDDEGVMTRSLTAVGGEILLVSQFTLFASTKKGNRPGYSRASRPEIAIPLYEQMVASLSQSCGREV